MSHPRGHEVYIGQLHGPPWPIPVRSSRQCRCRLVRIYLSVFTPYPVPKARNPLFAMPAVSIHVHVFISLHLWNDSASYARDWASSHAFLSHPMTVCKKDSPFRGKIDGTDHLRSREPFKCLPTLSFNEHTPLALVSIIVKYYTYIYKYKYMIYIYILLLLLFLWSWWLFLFISIIYCYYHYYYYYHENNYYHYHYHYYHYHYYYISI